MCGAVLFAPAVHTPFYYDDYPHFLENPKILRPHSLGEIFHNGFQETRPVYNLSLAPGPGFWEPIAPRHTPSTFSSTSATGLLLFFLVQRFGGDPALAFLTALLFLVHPVGVETVAYFNSRSGLLALVFGFSALLLLFSKGRARFGLGLLCLLLAMGAKEDGIAAVGWFFLLAFYIPASDTLRRKVLVALTVLTVPLLSLVFRSPHVDSVGSAVEPWPLYFWRQGAMIPLHLSLFSWPYPLTLDRDLPAWITSVPAVSLGWILLLSLTALAVRHRRSAASVGFLAALVALVPTHSVVPLLDQQGTRLLYAMLPGISLATAALLLKLSEKARPWAISLILVFSGFLAWRTHEQIALWQDPVALWAADAHAAPSRFRAWINLGVELGERGRWAEAQAALERAERLEPNHVDVPYNLAVVWAVRTDGLRNRDLALEKLRTALRLSPGHRRTRVLIEKLAPPRSTAPPHGVFDSGESGG